MYYSDHAMRYHAAELIYPLVLGILSDCVARLARLVIVVWIKWVHFRHVSGADIFNYRIYVAQADVCGV